MKVPPRSHGRREERARRSPVTRRIVLPAEEYLHSETISGFALFLAAAVALLWANSPWSGAYFDLRHLSIEFRAGSFALASVCFLLATTNKEGENSKIRTTEARRHRG